MKISISGQLFTFVFQTFQRAMGGHLSFNLALNVVTTKYLYALSIKHRNKTTCSVECTCKM